MDALLGVLGGMGPQATQVFCQRLLDRTDAAVDQEHIPMLIFSDSAVPDRTGAILSGETEGVYAHLLRDARVLEGAGCTLLAIPCNTSHFFVPRLQGELSIPILHMPRLAARRLHAQGRRRVGVLGTEGTVKTGIYRDACALEGLEVWDPDERTQALLNAIIYEEIKRGERGSREKFAQVDRALRSAGCDGAVLGCTELSVYRDYHGLPDYYTDAMDALAEECIRRCGRRLREV